MSSTLKIFSKRLRLERLKKDITQEELGRAIGVSSSAIGYWERGKREPSMDSLKKLADYFGCTVGYLVGHTNERVPLSKEDPEKVEILNRARNLSPEGWKQFEKALEWIFEVDKDRNKLEKLKKKAEKDFER